MFEFEIFASDNFFLISGITLILMVVVQMSFWVGGSISRYFAQKQQTKLSLAILEQKLAAAKVDRKITEGAVGWQGLRTFVVAKMVREAKDVTSIYLRPQDQRPLPFYKPGQYLTFSIDFPNEKKPIVRCYSLSDAPNQEYFRVTVKKALAPRDQSDAPIGRASSFVNDELQVGDLLQCKSPKGAFHVDLNDDRPVILMAAGIGVTPIFSMLSTMIKLQPHRRVIVFFGGTNSDNHPFRTEMLQISKQNRNVHIVTCYSNPSESDDQGVDYDVKGWVSIDLLRSTLPSNNFHYYLCGPPSFMRMLAQGLDEWGVPSSQVHSEGFGPSAERRRAQRRRKTGIESRRNIVAEGDSATNTSSQVSFTKSNVTVDWSDEFESILEVAEEFGIELDSGCRTGNCGTCEVALLLGKVRYTKDPGCQPENGCALSCVARPIGNVEIDA